MKTLIWAEIVCLSCSRHCYGQWVNDRVPIRVFRREAIVRKWTPTDSGEFRCPACQRGMLKAAPAAKGDV